MVPEEEFDAIMQSAIDAIDISIVFEDNGSVEVKNKVEDIDQSFSATWSVDGDTLVIHNEVDERVEAAIRDGKLYLTMPTGTEGLQEIRLTREAD